MKLAFVGCGRIARRHVEAISLAENLDITVFCDVVSERASSFGQEFGVQWVTSIDEIDEVDIVTIATPSGLHPQHVVEALEKTRARYIVCEKPVSLTVREVIEMYKAAARLKKTILPVFQNRYNPLIDLLKNLVRSGHLGRIFQFDINVFWNRNDEYYRDGWHGTQDLDGGVLYTQASHYVDMILYLLGKVREAKGYGGRMRGLQAHDTVSAAFHMEGGAIGSLNATVSVYRQNYRTEATLIAEKGTIRIAGTNLNTIEFWDVEGMPKPDVDFTIDHIYGRGHDIMYRYLVENRLNMFPTFAEVSEGIQLMERLSF